jgi:hypothetical protein
MVYNGPRRRGRSVRSALLAVHLLPLKTAMDERENQIFYRGA